VYDDIRTDGMYSIVSEIVRMPSEWVTKNRFDPGYLPEMEGKLFFEGERKLRSITN
jgi:hypothetical protein